MFARKTSEPLTSLVKQIDSKIGESNNLKSFVVVLTDKGEKTADELRKLADSAGISNVPLTMLQDRDGLPSYDIADDADFIVLMWRGSKVVVNHAFKGEPTEEQVRSIVADIPKVLK